MFYFFYICGTCKVPCKIYVLELRNNCRQTLNTSGIACQVALSEFIHLVPRLSHCWKHLYEHLSLMLPSTECDSGSMSATYSNLRLFNKEFLCITHTVEHNYIIQI